MLPGKPNYLQHVLQSFCRGGELQQMALSLLLDSPWIAKPLQGRQKSPSQKVTKDFPLPPYSIYVQEQPWVIWGAGGGRGGFKLWEGKCPEGLIPHNHPFCHPWSLTYCLKARSGGDLGGSKVGTGLSLFQRLWHLQFLLLLWPTGHLGKAFTGSLGEVKGAELELCQQCSGGRTQVVKTIILLILQEEIHSIKNINSYLDLNILHCNMPDLAQKWNHSHSEKSFQFFPVF